VIIAGCSDRKLGRKQGTTLPNAAHAPIARGHEIYGMTQTKTQTGTKSGRRWGAMLPSVLLLAGLLGMVAANKGLRQMFAQAVQTIDPWAVVAVLPVQFVAILLCTAAQQALKVGIPFRSSLIARLVRDAAHTLLLFPPGLGDVVGARAVVLLGGRGRAAVALRALDIIAECIAELPYMALAGYVLWNWRREGGAVPTASGGGHDWWGLLAVPVLAYVGWRLWRKARIIGALSRPAPGAACAPKST
jgi:hypothetical protein